jgi:membrane associated rhomboid family serine protease
MNSMNPILIIIIAATCLISFYAFRNIAFRQKYLFQVGAIENRKEYIRLLSSGFLHADEMHLFMNMFSLYMFAGTVINGTFTKAGNYIEGFGVLGFIIIYIGAILFGNAFSLFIYRNQPYYSALGASGGVSGVIFAAVALAPNDVSINFIPGFLFGAIYFGYSVYMMLYPKQWDNLGHAAHLGGAFFGLIYAVANKPQVAMANSLYLGIMALPLIYLSYEIFVKKRIK